jgi:hypothetical protein
MSLSYYKEFPKISDVVVFDIQTYDDKGILVTPYSVDRVMIYYVEKDKEKPNDLVLEERIYNGDLREIR